MIDSLDDCGYSFVAIGYVPSGYLLWSHCMDGRSCDFFKCGKKLMVTVPTLSSDEEKQLSQEMKEIEQSFYSKLTMQAPYFVASREPDLAAGYQFICMVQAAWKVSKSMIAERVENLIDVLVESYKGNRVIQSNPGIKQIVKNHLLANAEEEGKIRREQIRREGLASATFGGRLTKSNGFGLVATSAMVTPYYLKITYNDLRFIIFAPLLALAFIYGQKWQQEGYKQMRLHEIKEKFYERFLAKLDKLDSVNDCEAKESFAERRRHSFL